MQKFWNGAWWRLYAKVNALNATELYPLNWQILCYAYFTTVFKKPGKGDRGVETWALVTTQTLISFMIKSVSEAVRASVSLFIKWKCHLTCPPALTVKKIQPEQIQWASIKRHAHSSRAGPATGHAHLPWVWRPEAEKRATGESYGPGKVWVETSSENVIFPFFFQVTSLSAFLLLLFISKKKSYQLLLYTNWPQYCNMKHSILIPPPFFFMILITPSPETDSEGHSASISQRSRCGLRGGKHPAKCQQRLQSARCRAGGRALPVSPTKWQEWSIPLILKFLFFFDWNSEATTYSKQDAYIFKRINIR